MEKDRKKKTKGYTDADLMALIGTRKASSLNTEEGDLSDRRKDALDRYLGKKYGDERTGQSQVVTRQCLEAVEWSLPSLMRVFASSDKIAEFEPVGPEDEEQAKQETDYINHVFMKQNDGFVVLYTWIKDILMNPNGYIKVFWEEEDVVTTETYEGLNEDDLAMLDQDDTLEPMEKEEVQSIEITPLGEVPVVLYNVKYRRTVTEGRVVVSPIPAEELSIDGKLPTVSLENADFITHTTQLSRSTLIQRGYDESIVNSLPAVTNARSEDSEKSNRFESIVGSDGADDTSTDKASELVEIEDCVMYLDYDGDGIAEFRHILGSGKHIFENEEIDYNPFLAGTAVPLPHSHVGLSWQELVEDLQKIYTTLTRQLLNNLYRTNNPRTIVGRGVNLNDVLNDLPNSPIRATNIENIRIEPTAPVIQNVLPAFDMLDKNKESRIGVSRSTMGLDADALSRVTKGAFLGSLEQANQRLELLARILAEFSIKPLFLKIHRLLLTHQTFAKSLKVAGEWLTVNPSEWRERKDMSILVGLGTGNKQAQAEAINRILEVQHAVLQAGMPLVSPQEVFNSAAHLVKLAGLPNAEKYFKDPTKMKPEELNPPKPPGEEEALAAAQMELAKVEREKAQLKNQTDMLSIQQKAQAEQQRLQAKIADLEAAIMQREQDMGLKIREMARKELEVLLKSELEQTKILSSNMKDLQQQQEAARSQFDERN